MSKHSFTVFDAFVEQVVSGQSSQEHIRKEAARVFEQLSPDQLVQAILGFIFQNHLSRKGVSGLACVPFLPAEDGTDYPGVPFLLGAPGPLSDAQNILLAARALEKLSIDLDKAG